jgi:DNA uptake protein ComE-like DNA-binding protein
MPVVVEILGDVQEPGVHFLEPTGPQAAPTVRHAVEAAGGLSRNPSAGMPPGFDKQAVQSGQRIRVTYRDSVGLPQIELELMDAAARLTLGLKLNPNEASVEELCMIPQMKPEMASQIVMRRAKKPWRELQELQEITGVGPRTLEKWKEYLEITTGN